MATMIPGDIEEFGTEGEKGLLSRQREATAFGRDVAPLGRSPDATGFARRAPQVPRGGGQADQVCGVIRSIGLSGSLSH